MPECVQADIYQSGARKTVVFQKDCPIGGRLIDPDEPSAKEWRGLVGRELGQDTDFVQGAPPANATPIDTAGFYTKAGLADLISRENQTAFDLLVRQLRSPMGIVPFVGAGISVPFGFPSWSKFLTDAAEFCRDPEKVLDLVQNNRFIEAANVLWEDSPDRFQNSVAQAFGREVSPEQTLTGPLSLLPALAGGPVITTNFDHALETAFRAAGAPFDNIITGPQPDSLIGAMHRNEHVLIKMHGDASDRSARIFTGNEYAAQYDDAAPGSGRPGQATISQLAFILFTNRPLLFLGSSLDKDRTLDVLKAIKQRLPGLTHYGIVAASLGLSRHRARRAELDSYGISALWFAPGDFGHISVMLQQLIQEASTKVRWKPATPAKPPAPRASTVPAPAPAPPAAPDPSACTRELISLLNHLARRIVSGRLAFFLGAGVHLDAMIDAVGFYEQMAQQYTYGGPNREAVAQYVVDLEGKADAWARARRQFLAQTTPPSVVLRFILDLPRLLGEGKARQLWVLTTNYDVVCERAFEAAGEPFHLLYYQPDGPDEGHFLHRSPDGIIRVIERPEKIRMLEGAHVLVKLDGGLAAYDHIPESVALSPWDFTVSAVKLPAALPAAVVDVVRANDLLVLGSSMRTAQIQRLIRWSAEGACAPKTWAILKPVPPEEQWNWADTQRNWAAARVSLQACDLTVFIDALRWHVTEQLKQS